MTKLNIPTLKERIKTLQTSIEKRKTHHNNNALVIEKEVDELKKIQRQLEEAESDKELTVSEHAMVRLLERKGFDIEKLKQTLLNQIKATGLYSKNCLVPIDNDLVAVIRDYTVVTIQPKETKPKLNPVISKLPYRSRTEYPIK